MKLYTWSSIPEIRRLEISIKSYLRYNAKGHQYKNCSYGITIGSFQNKVTTTCCNFFFLIYMYFVSFRSFVQVIQYQLFYNNLIIFYCN